MKKKSEIFNFIKNNNLFIKINELLKSKYFKLLLFLIYLVYIIVLTLHHEFWTDEAQAYLLAKNLSFPKLIKQLCVEGHPFSWYLFIKGFIFLKIPYKYFGWLSALSAIIAVFIYLKNSKFNGIIDFIILLCPMTMYYSSILTRSYSLVMLFGIILMTIYSEREKHYIIYGLTLLLLINTHLLVSGFVIGIVLVDMFNTLIKKGYISERLYISYLLAFMGFCFLFMQLYGSLDSNFLVPKSNRLNIFFMKTNFFSIVKGIVGYEKLYFIFIIGLILLFIYMILNKKINYILILALGIVFQMVVFCLMWGFSNYMASISLMIILFIVFNLIKECDKYKLLLYLSIILMFGSSIKNGIILAKADYDNSFSDAPNAAEFINKTYNNEKIMCINLVECITVIPYMNDNNILLDYKGNEIKFVDWRNNVELRAEPNQINENFNDKYVLTSNRHQVTKVVSAETHLDIRFESKEEYGRENFYLFEIKK